MPAWASPLPKRFPKPRAAFAEADAALGFSISKLCFEGPEEELKRTEITQPALVTVSVAAVRGAADARASRRIMWPGTVLGEYSALVAAGSLDFARCGAPGSQARPLYAGGGAGRRGRDGGAAETARGNARPDSRRSGAGRSGHPPPI